jgi:hypothetical protein
MNALVFIRCPDVPFCTAFRGGRKTTVSRETAMREDKIFAAGNAMPARWPVEDAPPEREQSLWRIGRWFARRPPSLYQRCLAVHIYYASKQTSLH